MKKFPLLFNWNYLLFNLMLSTSNVERQWTTISYFHYSLFYRHMSYLSSFVSFPSWRVLDHLLLMLKLFHTFDQLCCPPLNLYFYYHILVRWAIYLNCMTSSANIPCTYAVEKLFFFLFFISWHFIWFWQHSGHGCLAFSWSPFIFMYIYTERWQI